MHNKILLEHSHSPLCICCQWLRFCSTIEDSVLATETSGPHSLKYFLFIGKVCRPLCERVTCLRVSGMFLKLDSRAHRNRNLDLASKDVCFSHSYLTNTKTKLMIMSSGYGKGRDPALHFLTNLLSWWPKCRDCFYTLYE